MRNVEELSDPAVAKLEAALRGELSGPDADSWRSLRADVRSLASPIDPDFQARLKERLRSAPAPAAPARETPFGRLARGLLRDRRLAGGLIASLAILVVAIEIVWPSTHGGHPAPVRSLDTRGVSSAAGASKFEEVARPHRTHRPLRPGALRACRNGEPRSRLPATPPRSNS